MADAIQIESLWTVDDVCTYLKASRSWVYERAASAELPSTKLRGLLRFEPEVVRAFARGEGTKGGRIVLMQPAGSQ